MASILSITNVFDKEQKRKNRWTLRFVDLPIFDDPNPGNIDVLPTRNQVRKISPEQIRDVELSLLSASRPQLSVGETEFHRLNEKYYYPEGKATFETIEVVFYDTIGINAGKYMNDWMRSVFDYKTGAIGYKKSFVSQGNLYMLDPKGTIIEDWTLVNCWPTTVNFQDLSYEDTGAAQVSITLRFDRAIPVFYPDPQKERPTEFGWAGHPFGIPGPNSFNQFGNNPSDFPG